MDWNVLAQRSTPLMRRLATLLAYTLIACIFVACSSANPPSAGPSSNKCDAPAPPRNNVRAQADNCGVSGLEIVRKDVLPKAPKVGIVTIDLYIEQHDVCAIVNVLCLLGDNRPFVSSGQPDPKADYSRNRAHMILDFRTGQLTLIVNPSCRIHPLGVGWDPNKECFAPQNEGSGTDLKLNVASDGTVDIEVTLHQSDYPSGGTCDLYNHFSILPHNDAGTFDLTGEGSGFPDLAVIQGGQVVYADQGTHATELCFSPVYKRHYDYHPGPRETPTTENPLGKVDWTKVVTETDLGCNGPTGPNLGVEVDEKQFADVDGDGMEEAFVAVACVASTSSWPDRLEVFDGASDPSHPRHIATLLDYQDGTDERGLRMGSNFGIPQSITISGQTVSVVSLGYAPTDPDCCPRWQVTDTFTWNGSGFTRGPRSVVQAKAPLSFVQ